MTAEAVILTCQSNLFGNVKRNADAIADPLGGPNSYSKRVPSLMPNWRGLMG